MSDRIIACERRGFFVVPEIRRVVIEVDLNPHEGAKEQGPALPCKGCGVGDCQHCSAEWPYITVTKAPKL